MATCRVSYTNEEGVHSVEVTAESLYEAVALAIAEFRDDRTVSNPPGPETDFMVRVMRKPIDHVIKLKRVQEWAELSNTRVTSREDAAGEGEEDAGGEGIVNPPTRLRTEPYISGLVFPTIKANRAGDLLNQLDLEIERYRTSNFYSTTDHNDVRQQLHVKTIRVLPTLEMIPLLWGEFLYNLRSCLDHLAWQLALKNVPTPHERTAFPIFVSAEEAKKLRYYTRDIADEARSLIESFQPYRHADPEQQPLWLLNKLCNIDKHALPAFRCNDYGVTFEGAQPLRRHETDDVLEFTFSLSDRFIAKVILTMETMTLGKPMDSLGPSPEAPLSALRDIHRHVTKEVLPTFGKFFP